VENYEKTELDLPEYVTNKKSRINVGNHLKQFFWEHEKYIKGFISFLVLLLMVTQFFSNLFKTII